MSYENLNEQNFADVFVEHLLDTNRGYNYYVDWKNVEGYEKYLIEFHAMDSLIRCKNIHEMFVQLVKRVPTVIETFPFLFGLAKAERKQTMQGKSLLKVVGSELDSDDFQEYSFNIHSRKTNLTDGDIEQYYCFFEQMGLKNLYENFIEKSTLDYVIGVLVGLDSNGRKNRGGKAFEIACEPIIQKICNTYELEMLMQKEFKVLESKGYHISEDMKNRKADFIIYGKGKCLNIEVNFYNGAGSKPEEIIDSYITRQNELQADGIQFILITDGACWNDADKNQLKKGFRHLKCFLNFRLAKEGLLEEAIKNAFGLN